MSKAIDISKLIQKAIVHMGRGEVPKDQVTAENKTFLRRFRDGEFALYSDFGKQIATCFSDWIRSAQFENNPGYEANVRLFNLFVKLLGQNAEEKKSEIVEADPLDEGKPTLIAQVDLKEFGELTTGPDPAVVNAGLAALVAKAPPTELPPGTKLSPVFLNTRELTGE
jgi:hypothetical protein